MDAQQFRSVLQRAEEIDAQRAQQVDISGDLDSMVDAAVEAGLSRESVEQALQERLAIESISMQPGDLCFALSTDGCMYPARLRSTDGEVVEVDFLNGSSHRLMKRDVQAFSLIPGSKVVAPWPSWGDWTCTVLSYDRENLRVRVSDGWGSEQNFAVADIRINPPAEPGSVREKISYWAHYAFFVAGGGAVGAFITYLIMRR